jgi:haloacetate dehalogenase
MSSEAPLFDQFHLTTVTVPAGTLRVRHGGAGPPLLLLHGHPRTHMTWGQVADLLAPHFTVVCPDLPGFGGSYAPADTPDHAGSSKRAKAQACVDLMHVLGHERFAVAGHDRGSYVAYRAALDHPDSITKLVVMDGVPILEALERADEKFARLWWHWFFFAVPEKPERAILADPDAWYGGSPRLMGAEAYADFRSATRDPAVVHTMVEDYRAGLGVDRAHDLADREAGRKIRCPTLFLWSRRDDMETLYGDPLVLWRAWAPDVRGGVIDSGHHMTEEAPGEVAAALLNFLNDDG